MQGPLKHSCQQHERGENMEQGTSLLVGLKAVNPSYYDGWTGENGCWGCELDVDNLNSILSSVGYDVRCLKTAEATAGNVLDALDAASRAAQPGSIFVFYYSGHGGQQPDENGDELDGQDETLVAYDRQILDDELNKIWLQFQPGVRIVMLSDSCNSGTNYRHRVLGDWYKPSPIVPVDEATADQMKAQLIHFGGCRDGYGSSGYKHGGAFTIALCEAWADGAFQGSYEAFHKKICDLIQSDQKPQFNKYGPVSAGFLNQKPFSI